MKSASEWHVVEELATGMWVERQLGRGWVVRCLVAASPGRLDIAELLVRPAAGAHPTVGIDHELARPGIRGAITAASDKGLRPRKLASILDSRRWSDQEKKLAMVAVIYEREVARGNGRGPEAVAAVVGKPFAPSRAG